jgi:[acyl-carrier-protein] S-malonyltransferase
LEPWLEDSDNRALLTQWSSMLDVDLVTHGTLSDEATIKDTAIAQPLIVAAGILSGRSLLAGLPAGVPLAFAGHSVGEYTAAALTGVLTAEEALTLVTLRGQAMAHASALTPSGMSAVLGGETQELEAHLEKVGLRAANYNGGGQVVIAGSLPALAEFAENPLPGTRVIPLAVAGAFHTAFMETAVEKLSDAAAQLAPHDPHYPLYTNRDGSLLQSGNDALGALVTQVTQPVRWDLCMESFQTKGIQGMIELAPAGALVGLAKRGLKGVLTVALNTPEDQAKAWDMVTRS